ncbi:MULTISPECIES: AAA-like domain-containing protein [Calothrix]|uniref:AAA-like domain-containing protein n=2 Tax=Calothrix TaxID=1186 RepID=A0ABR8AHN4_9CYAN|nr:MULTISPECIES: AAA-like domain-containing protein [Calothrix]MBD2199453.1 AAA-like domain-containing protein [Calothrix parietina FACHB-288]MBD2228259.1 AAA-like domain-containing protein [Calothrix anomala FACHB-343]
MKRILILSANPTNTNKLRLDEEVREIQAGLERAKSRDKFEIITKWAVRTDDLRRGLLDYEPQIVHFSGHGAGSEGLALENSTGQMQLVSTASLARLFKLFQDKVECVLLNACYSEAQAEAIYQYIDCVVGMNQQIGDRAAIEFAVGFYDALGANRTYEDAYEFGCSAIDLEGIPESSTPVLKSRNHPSQAVSPEPLPPTPIKNTPVIATINLEDPEGQVPLESAFYVERPPIEADAYETILKPGALIRVKAPRQMGKTSLMTRILHHAKQQSYQIAALNFQSADAEFLSNLDKFLQWFCASITYELNLPDKLEDSWKGLLGSKNKCTNYFQRYLLAEIKTPIALGLDEVDEVFKHPEIADGFFGLLRFWHERAKNEPIWQKLRLIIVHSKEVYIPLNINQSPFNVGLPIELPELNQAQVQDLILRHQLDWNTQEIEQLMLLVGGHPYLVRVALYQIARSRLTLAKLQQVASMEEGPYCDHLRRHLLNLQEDEDLLNAIIKVVTSNTAVDVGTTEAFKLRSMGLVKFQGNKVIPLCDLYRQYFGDRLGVK